MMCSPLDYAGRARFYDVELRDLPPPRLLREVVDRFRPARILEVPCGTGHYLPLYQRTSTVVALVDAEPAMRSRAWERATALGLSVDRGMAPARLECLRADPTNDLVVVPKGAANLLAAGGVVTSVVPGSPD